MIGSIDPATIVAIAQSQEDDSEDDRGRDSIAPDDRDRVADRHDLNREGCEAFEKGDDIEDDIHSLEKKFDIADHENREICEDMEHPCTPYASGFLVEPREKYSSCKESEKRESEDPSRKPRSEYRNMIE